MPPKHALSSSSAVSSATRRVVAFDWVNPAADQRAYDTAPSDDAQNFEWATRSRASHLCPQSAASLSVGDINALVRRYIYTPVVLAIGRNATNSAVAIGQLDFGTHNWNVSFDRAPTRVTAMAVSPSDCRVWTFLSHDEGDLNTTTRSALFDMRISSWPRGNINELYLPLVDFHPMFLGTTERAVAIYRHQRDGFPLVSRLSVIDAFDHIAINVQFMRSPVRRFGFRASTIAHGSRALVVGGLDNAGDLNRVVEIYNVAEDRWTRGGFCPKNMVIAFHAIEMDGDQILLGAPLGNTHGSANENVWRFDHRTSTWSALATRPGARADSCVTNSACVLDCHTICAFTNGTAYTYDTRANAWAHNDRLAVPGGIVRATCALVHNK